MKIENDNLYFDSEKEKELYLDLKDYLLKEYKGKRALKRLVNNIVLNEYCLICFLPDTLPPSDLMIIVFLLLNLDINILL